MFNKIKLMCFFALFTNFAFAQVWSQLPDLPALERDDGVAKTINNKAYFGSGLRTGFTLGGDFYALDLITNTWTTVASMPAGSERQYAVAFTYSNYLFVHGGSGSGPLFSDTYRYDVTTNTWTTVASKPGSAVMAASSFTLNNKAYVFSGRFGSNIVSDEVWEYDMLTNVWTQKNNFPFGGRWRASAATLNGVGYVMFGKDNAGSIRKEIYKYSQSTDNWTKVTDFPQPKGRYYVGMQNAGSKLVLLGGIDTLDTYYNDCWFFDDATNTFSLGPVLPSFGRKGGMCCSNGNNFYYSCGVTAVVRVKETWMLDVLAGLQENENKNNFSIFPNPCNDVLTVNSSLNSNCKIELLNMLGQIVFKIDLDPFAVKKISVSSLAKGIYFLKFFNGETLIETKKIVKE